MRELIRWKGDAYSHLLQSKSKANREEKVNGARREVNLRGDGSKELKSLMSEGV